MGLQNSPSRPGLGRFMRKPRVRALTTKPAFGGKRTHPPPGSEDAIKRQEAARGAQRLRTRSPGGPDLGAGWFNAALLAG